MHHLRHPKSCDNNSCNELRPFVEKNKNKANAATCTGPGEIAMLTLNLLSLYINEPPTIGFAHGAAFLNAHDMANLRLFLARRGGDKLDSAANDPAVHTGHAECTVCLTATIRVLTLLALSTRPD